MFTGNTQVQQKLSDVTSKNDKSAKCMKTLGCPYEWQKTGLAIYVRNYLHKKAVITLHRENLTVGNLPKGFNNPNEPCKTSNKNQKSMA